MELCLSGFYYPSCHAAQPPSSSLLGRLAHTHGLTAQLLLNDCGSLVTHFLLAPGLVLFFCLQTQTMSLEFPRTSSNYFHLVPPAAFLFEAMACGGNFFLVQMLRQLVCSFENHFFKFINNVINVMFCRDVKQQEQHHSQYKYESRKHLHSKHAFLT